MTAVDDRGAFAKTAGFTIGLVITIDVFVGANYTGAAMNPARWFGPALATNDWANWWVWYLGPLLGGAAAAILYEYLYLRPLRPVPVGAAESGLDEPRPGETAVS